MPTHSGLGKVILAVVILERAAKMLCRLPIYEGNCKRSRANFMKAGKFLDSVT